MKLKNINSISALSAVFAMTLVSAHAALVTYTQGDLLMGFRATSGQGAGTSYVVNIGQASGYRDATTYGTVPIAGNIDADLTAIYGSGWSSRTDILWGIVGTPSNTATVGGDDVPTLYATKPGSATTGWQISGSSTRVAVATTIVSLQTSFATYTASANSAAAAIMTDSDQNTWRQYMASGGNGAYTAGNKDFGGFANIEGSLQDVLSLSRTTNASAGTIEGTFSISPAGLSFVPEPTSALLAGLGAVTLLLRRRRA